MDQAEPEDQGVLRYLGERSADADLDSTLCVPGTGLVEVHVKDHHLDAADVTVITAESVRAKRLGKLIQTNESIAKSSTGAALKTMGQQWGC